MANIFSLLHSSILQSKSQVLQPLAQLHTMGKVSGLLSFTALLSACQTLPTTPHLPKSERLTQQLHTIDPITPNYRLIEVISEDNSRHPNLSGYFPIITGADAFATRSILTTLASTTIDVQYYIWHDDEAGQLMLKDLYDAANRGVKVRLLLDDLNTNKHLDQQLLAFAQHPNVAVRLMNPKSQRKLPALNYVTSLPRFQRRMHNKSMTFDQQISIIGGRNIGDEYLRSDKATQFADLDVMLVGKVVGAVDDSFEQYWAHSMAYDIETLVQPNKPAKSFLQTLDKIAGNNKNPQLASSASIYKKAIEDSTIDTDILTHQVPFRWTHIEFMSDDADKLRNKATPESYLVYKMREAMGEPQEQFTLISSYFVPNKQGVKELIALANKGVKIKILTNSFSATDVGIVHSGYSEIRKPLLQAGIELYELKTSAKISYETLNNNPNSKTNKRRLLTSFSSYITEEYNETKLGKKFPKRSSNKQPKTTRGTLFHTNQAEKRPSLTRANITTSLHTKTFAVDNDKVFIGSYNIDPRSANLNTELGVVIYDRQLANQLHTSIGESLLSQAYQVTLSPTGKLQWRTLTDTAASPAITPTIIQTQNEPKMSLVNQIWIRAFSFLPIKWLL